MTLTKRLFPRISVILLATILLVACGQGNNVAEEPSGEISDIPGEVPQQYRELVLSDGFPFARFLHRVYALFFFL